MKLPRSAIGAAAALVGLVFFGANMWRLAYERTKPAGVGPLEPPGDTAGGITLTAAVEKSQTSRTVRLELGGGEAFLVLADPGGSDPFGKGTLAARDRDSGAKFVAAIANWLRVEPPAPRADQTPLMPVPIGYARLPKS